MQQDLHTRFCDCKAQIMLLEISSRLQHCKRNLGDLEFCQVFFLISVTLDVAYLHPPPCVQYSIYTMPSHQHRSVHKLVNDSCVLLQIQHSPSSKLRPRWELGTALGVFWDWCAVRNCSENCFCSFPGLLWGSLSVRLQCLTLHTTTTCAQESCLIRVNSSVSCASLWNVYHFCQQTTCFPPPEKCAPVRTPESLVEKQPNSSQSLFSSPRSAATARDHSLNINTYMKINYLNFSFHMEKWEITRFLGRSKPQVSVRVEELTVWCGRE